MLSPLKDVTKLVSTAGNIADDLIESGEERQTQLSSRHSVDMMSDSWLSKNVRPIAFIFAMLCQLIIVVASLFTDIDVWIVGQVGTILATTMGFYFSSRSSEKIAAKNADTNLKMEEMKIKAKIKEDRLSARAERRAERKQNN